MPKFLVQLVDPVTRIRIDIFPDLAGSISRSSLKSIGSEQVQVLALEDILDHKLQTLSNASPAAPVDPKHLEDARQLGRVLGRQVRDVPAGCLVEEAVRVE